MYENLTNKQLMVKAKQILEDLVAFTESGGEEDSKTGKQFLSRYSDAMEEMIDRDIRQQYIWELVQ